jgi:thiol-disulfide isomerase/thioredoxin
MKQRVVVLSLLLVAALTAGSLYAWQRAEAKESEKKAVDLTLKDLEGKKVSLKDLRGKVVVVDVWATWCHYCVEEIPDLIAMQKAAEKEKTPLQIIGISVDRDKDAVKPFAKEHKINYPILYSEEKALKKAFGDVYGLPTKFILNDKGVVVDKIIGALPAKKMQERIEKHLPKKK